MTTCPTEDQLDRYVVRNCRADEADHIRAHVARCMRCEDRLREAEADQVMAQAVKKVMTPSGGRMDEEPPTLSWHGGSSAAETGPCLSDDYEPIQRCGSGAFGQVWIVRDRAGAYRAMKIIDVGQAAEAPGRHREQAALEHYCRRVPDHANLIRIFHIGRRDTRLYYTMELADDLTARASVCRETLKSYRPMTLKGVLAGSRLTTDVAVEITLRILRGLARLHEVGLVHRDIKPDNIIFANRQVKLADISLVGQSRTRMTTVGTPRYMPPDDCMNATADTYAVGKILYEMLTGRNMSRFPLLPPDVRSERIQVDLLEPVIGEACASRAEERFANATDMIKALAECRAPLLDESLFDLAVSEPAAEPSRRFLKGGRPPVRAKRRPHIPRPDEAVWAVLDRLLKTVPWIVILILGLVLIMRLT